MKNLSWRFLQINFSSVWQNSSLTGKYVVWKMQLAKNKTKEFITRKNTKLSIGQPTGHSVSACLILVTHTTWRNSSLWKVARVFLHFISWNSETKDTSCTGIKSSYQIIYSNVQLVLSYWILIHLWTVSRWVARVNWCIKSSYKWFGANPIVCY